MRITEAPLPGAFVLDIDRHEDERGFFARVACVDEFHVAGMDFHPLQQSLSWNRLKGTLRGLHFQATPHSERKLIRCIAGSIFDVIVDIRPASPTFTRWFSCELTATNRRSLFVPEGFAHGFQTLEDGSEVLYQMSTRYRPEAARGIRWNDPDLAIPWPLPKDPIVSQSDRNWPTLAMVGVK